MSSSLIRRGRTWYLKRRVPARFVSVESRPVIWESLKTDLQSVAMQKAERVWTGYLEA
ncbi:DUF6538 domain-containing protein [Wenxinia saemankumensis]|uniref:DUF6538 domain-containing protein n=1 Tax=Wenxinia saemankumensis TaxID=1447782 RepID=UPI003CC80C63